MAAEYELFEPPNDAISSVVFHPSKPEVLMVSSWDKVTCVFVSMISNSCFTT
jgi:cell cycle arrest protein BUB3